MADLATTTIHGNLIVDGGIIICTNESAQSIYSSEDEYNESIRQAEEELNKPDTPPEEGEEEEKEEASRPLNSFLANENYRLQGPATGEIVFDENIIIKSNKGNITLDGNLVITNSQDEEQQNCVIENLVAGAANNLNKKIPISFSDGFYNYTSEDILTSPELTRTEIIVKKPEEEDEEDVPVVEKEINYLPIQKTEEDKTYSIKTEDVNKLLYSASNGVALNLGSNDNLLQINVGETISLISKINELERTIVNANKDSLSLGTKYEKISIGDEASEIILGGNSLKDILEKKAEITIAGQEVNDKADMELLLEDLLFQDKEPITLQGVKYYKSIDLDNSGQIDGNEGDNPSNSKVAGFYELKGEELELAYKTIRDKKLVSKFLRELFFNYCYGASPYPDTCKKIKSPKIFKSENKFLQWLHDSENGFGSRIYPTTKGNKYANNKEW